MRSLPAAYQRRLLQGGHCVGGLTHTVIDDVLLVLQMLGEEGMRPFLQDTIQFWPLSAAMTGTLFVAPLTIMRVLIQVGS